jgi:GH25 family lysozyme M1 (1,4-beta-N-acetylmuramidase)
MTQRKILIALVVVLSLVLAALLGVVWLLGQDAPEPVPVPQQTKPLEPTLPPPTENVFTPLDFGYEGEYLTCLTAPSVLGIDVSRYQGDIDWAQVKQAGVEFAMLKAAFRGYGQAGVLKEDPKVRQNYENATAAGVKVGVYFFSQAISVEEAVEEAQFLLEIIDGWELQMPVAFDWECLADDYRTLGTDKRTVTDCAKAFCDTLEEKGYDTMVYFNPSQSRFQMHLEELVDYGFWLAMYSDQMTYEYKVDMWQYTNKGSVPGIKGDVDINLYFPYEE